MSYRVQRYPTPFEMQTGCFTGRGFFRVDYEKKEEHVEALKLGLARLGENFYAHVCSVCGGTGRNARSYWGCEYCNETGLCQGSGWKNGAPLSVLNQVLVAAEREETQ